jgi:hypothetical protein
VFLVLSSAVRAILIAVEVLMFLVFFLVASLYFPPSTRAFYVLVISIVSVSVHVSLGLVGPVVNVSMSVPFLGFVGTLVMTRAFQLRSMMLAVFLTLVKVSLSARAVSFLIGEILLLLLCKSSRHTFK